MLSNILYKLLLEFDKIYMTFLNPVNYCIYRLPYLPQSYTQSGLLFLSTKAMTLYKLMHTSLTSKWPSHSVHGVDCFCYQFFGFSYNLWWSCYFNLCLSIVIFFPGYLSILNQNVKHTLIILSILIIQTYIILNIYLTFILAPLLSCSSLILAPPLPSISKIFI